MRFSEADHALVTEAVAQAELATDGEIVAIVAARSDRYGDVGVLWAVLAMLSTLTLLVWRPGIAERLYRMMTDEWAPVVPASKLLLIALLLTSMAFLIVSGLMASAPLRMLLTPETTKAGRVHRHALDLFRVAVERRTRAATGVLLYVSLAERRAEIVADHAIHSRVDKEVWGEAMHVLVSAIHDGRPGEGMRDAVAQAGMVLAEHFPNNGANANELPDRLIEL